MARFKRILLKLSGESLMGKQGYGIDPERLSDYARQIKEVSEMGVQIGIVIGGGNIHGNQFAGIELGTGCYWREEQGADGYPHGTHRRVLHEVEGYRSYGTGLCVHLLGRNGVTLLYDGHGLIVAWYRD